MIFALFLGIINISGSNDLGQMCHKNVPTKQIFSE